MTIHINRAGTALGQFSKQELEDGHKEGKFLSGDLVWTSGMKEWVSLEKFLTLDHAAISEASLKDKTAEAGSTEDGIAWERREELGFWRGLMGTVRDVLFEPGTAFANMKKEGGVGGSIFYYTMLVVIGATVASAYSAVFETIINLHQGKGEPAAVLMEGLLTPAFTFIFVLIFAPLFQFPLAAIMHLSLLVVGGARQGFTSTLKTLSYANGSTSVLYLVPFCGGIFYFFWSVFSTVVGLAKVNDIGYGRSVAAYVVNFAFCCTICTIPIAILMFTGAVDFDAIKGYLENL
jgi:hypothetical protein